MSILAKRSLVNAELAATRYGAKARGFYAPQREHVKQPMPPRKPA